MKKENGPINRKKRKQKKWTKLSNNPKKMETKKNGQNCPINRKKWKQKKNGQNCPIN
jgi:hypothetical protein